MNKKSPVFTTEAECQDCFKCVRNCPAKAIRIKDGHAEVISELCVACGRCISVCPAKAKCVRDDMPKVLELLASGAKVHASLAPSWKNEFPELAPAGICAILRKLGFAGVSETALGAQRVSKALADQLNMPDAGAVISSACPAVKEFVRIHIPEWSHAVSVLPSPLLEHCRMIKEKFGDDVPVVFIGPCVAKKIEADNHPDLLAVALGFTELRKLMQERKIDAKDFAGISGKGFDMESAEEGALYPVEGGMIESMKVHKGVSSEKGVALSGLDNLRAALNGADPAKLKEPLLIEALACFGGCVNGPCVGSGISALERMAGIRRSAPMPKGAVKRVPAKELECPVTSAPVEREPLESEIIDALKKVGKVDRSDELNCGGCGYDTCRRFARALALGKAEPAMCASYMRQLATKKANALLNCMPCGVVIVDSDMKIVECNHSFVDMLDDGAKLAFEACPGLVGANIHKLIPFGDLFTEAFETGRELERAHCRMNGMLIDISIFVIEPGRTVGATFSNVTGLEKRRDQIARKAREVLAKNLVTVQDIAWKLGEHMADTEILLRSIADGYSSEDGAAKGWKKEDDKDDGKPGDEI